MKFSLLWASSPRPWNVCVGNAHVVCIAHRSPVTSQGRPRQTTPAPPCRPSRDGTARASAPGAKQPDTRGARDSRTRACAPPSAAGSECACSGNECIHMQQSPHHRDSFQGVQAEPRPHALQERRLVVRIGLKMQRRFVGKAAERPAAARPGVGTILSSAAGLT